MVGTPKRTRLYAVLHACNRRLKRVLNGLAS